MEEKIKKLTDRTNRVCDVLDKSIAKPILKEGLSVKDLMGVHQFVARVAEHWADFESHLKSHPETKELPWAKDFINTVKRLKKTIRDFDEVGMTPEEIRLKRRFFRQSSLCGRLITIYERIIIGKRKPVNDQEQRLLNNIRDRVHRDIESTKPDSLRNRWISGTFNSQLQILSCINSIQRV